MSITFKTLTSMGGATHAPLALVPQNSSTQSHVIDRSKATAAWPISFDLIDGAGSTDSVMDRVSL